jgi:hypothetical protein
MQSSLRRVLADSHIAAVTIAVLVMWALVGTFRGLWAPAYRLGAFVLTAIAIWDIPYIPPKPTLADNLMLISAGYYLYSALVCLLGAQLLSHWVYDMGPLQSLTAYGSKLIGRKNV